MILKSINPYNGQLIRETAELTDDEAESRIGLSADAFEEWRKTSLGEREKLFRNLSRLLKEKKQVYAETITTEMGKPIRESRAEIEKCAWVCDFYAEQGASFLIREIIETDAEQSFITYEPLGSILGIMPWNFPFWQVFRFAVPAVMAGNTGLLKHASNVQGCGGQIEDAFREAGFPSGVFLNLAISSQKMQRIIENDKVKAVSVTGSETTGSRVASVAAGKIKKSVLELGGSNGFIILEDADIQKAVETGVQARMQNAGQSCIAAKRFIVHQKISDQFMALFSEKIRSLRTGDPMLENTDIGPLSSEKQAEAVEKQVRDSVNMGARIITGGYPEGAIYPPTLLAEVQPGMPVFDEEVFGPVAPVIIVKDAESAIRLSNQSRFGLGVSVFTNDIEKAKKLVPEFNEGAVFINALVKSDPRLPFGGVKKSGYGRELAMHGIREFVNVKSVFVASYSR